MRPSKIKALNIGLKQRNKKVYSLYKDLIYKILI
nr:MAG TPA: hypothetical protein [Caudoviricetes sp.]